MEPLAEAMRRAAVSLLGHLDDRQRAAALHPFDDDSRRWIEYRPRQRPGVCVDDLDRAGRKAVHRLLATALSPHAFAQAETIMALEEVLDRAEGYQRGRHSNDYWVAVYGDPDPDGRWTWRVEGHHLSVSMTLAGDAISPAPVFLGANPASVLHGGRTVVRPLAAEEELARALLDAMGPEARGSAVVADTAPDDILSAQRPSVDGRLEPLGVSGARLDGSARALLDALVALYVERLVPALAGPEAARLRPAELSFAWAGAAQPGSGHYYRIQGPDLLIEYDNTQDGANHAHTVLRRPGSDFGADLLAAHRAEVAHDS
jgi:Protein of unknown function (DUF3500)